ncbi:hypothetical protein [Novosphingobium sp. FKTRR1]|uniref:hypothetical protein n=1 Tax=Novosphingobium sp. FKTRR1 TaxID=2879118 RepID=UPI001CF0388A|nr:hypothetical protein [Novosphingobium sp. FKTRR1]
MNIKKFLAWLKARALERSTYLGIAAIAGAVGAQKLGVQIGQIGEAVTLIAGTGLAAATTSPPGPASVIGDVVGGITPN